MVKWSHERHEGVPRKQAVNLHVRERREAPRDTGCRFGIVSIKNRVFHPPNREDQKMSTAIIRRLFVP